ncbi:hypothetical protein [Evansella tamaricis]|uniref:Uncharacterized protein n=1 Tax=Evansella tamaricis TaxID=2069301 RepID=A0ABS6JJ25_9BACI|nr:hypothetical protein [Evansella tamaricis]MBU9713646.1 hypothetical protein [Evansella tamaricis]
MNSYNEFFGMYNRPSLNLFNDHCNYTLNEVNLKNSWIQGKVNGIQKEGKRWSVMTIKSSGMDEETKGKRG